MSLTHYILASNEYYFKIFANLMQPSFLKSNPQLTYVLQR